MGWLSKAWKGLKKGVKSIGKGIKSAFKSFGKFMGKIGIFGQVAMMFILPGVGQLLSGAFSSLVGTTAATATATATAATSAVAAGTATAAQATLAATVAGGGTAAASAVAGTGLLGSGSAILQGAGKVLQAAGNFVKVGHSAFKTVTEGITSFVGEMGKTTLNQIPGINISSGSQTFSGAWQKVQENIMTNAGQTVDAFNTAIGYTPTPAPVVTATPTMGTSGTPTATDSFGPMKEGYATPETASLAGPDTPYVDIPDAQNSLMAQPVTAPVTASTTNALESYGPLKANPQFSAEGLSSEFQPNFGPQEGQRGFFESASNKIQEAYRNATTSVTEGVSNFVDDPVGTLVGEDPVGKAFDTASGQVTGLLAQRGIMGKPEPARVFSTNIQGISPMASTIEYASPEINARAFEMNTNLFNFQAIRPWGASAYNNHLQTINKFYQGN